MTITTEGVVAILTAFAAVLAALAKVLFELNAMRKDLNGHHLEVVALAKAASRREGELLGRDFVPPPV